MAKKKSTEKKPREMTRRQLSHHKRQQRRQRIIIISGITVIVAIVLIVLAGWFTGEYMPMHRTVLKINDAKFDTRYFIDALKIYGANQQPEQFKMFGTTVMNYIIQNEIVLQEAEKLGINVTAAEIKKEIVESGGSVLDANIDIIRGQRVQMRLKSEYIDTLIPVSDNQVNINAMLVESESLALELRNRLLTSDNFSALAEEYAQNYTSKENNGEFGWHPEAILQDQLGSSIPIDFAFRAEPGTISQPLYDAEAYKQLGYWLIRVVDRNEEEGEAMVQALYLSSRAEALDLKVRLEAGDNLSALADQYSQYSPSQEAHGDLGSVFMSDDPERASITNIFDSYVFDAEVPLGQWSDPIVEDTLWTKGGAWLVEVVGKDDNRELSTEDRDVLVNQAFNDWFTELWQKTSEDVDRSGFTLELNEWATEKALEELQQGKG